MKKFEVVVTCLMLVMMGYVCYRITPKVKTETVTEVTVKGLDNEPMLGKVDAPYTVVLFSDYSCPFCKKAETESVVKIKELVKKGKVKYYFQDFPLEIHKNSMSQAIEGRCAWKVSSDYFLTVQAKLFGDKDFTPIKELQSCMQDKAQKVLVESSIARGKVIGVSGTPSFVVGKMTKGVVKGKLYIGEPKLDLI